MKLGSEEQTPCLVPFRFLGWQPGSLLFPTAPAQNEGLHQHKTNKAALLQKTSIKNKTEWTGFFARITMILDIRAMCSGWWVRGCM